jgi:hypothetical protein
MVKKPPPRIKTRENSQAGVHVSRSPFLPTSVTQLYSFRVAGNDASTMFQQMVASMESRARELSVSQQEDG